MQRALDVRRRVFVDEQGVPLEEEVDEHDLSDARAVHALAFDGEAVLGTGRFYEAEPGCVQIGRMAVRAEHRGKGVGRALLDALLEEAVRKAYRSARLLAQVDAIAFYERAGFSVAGEPVMDGGILHRPMEAALKESSSK